ncbi:hypothetical protein [Virgisporangium ochraceum]|uniref:hypothetical protein n=1 Tax=Virgisporangium ochraceum TaxID=65505 RepID=UPI0019427C12|nr:hypothetical protein [Virgisporangium ochraceum]
MAAASAAPKGFVVHTGDLVLSSVAGRYTGTMPVSVRNASGNPAASPFMKVTLPDGLRFVGAGVPCLVLSDGWGCGLGTFAAGERRTVTLSFGSSAGPERFARITAAATVTVTDGQAAPDARATDRYAGVLRSIFGSVRHPRPYTPSTVYDLALTANGGYTVTRAASAVTIRLPLVARNRTDATNDGAYVGATVDGVSVLPGVDPSAPCTSVCPVPGERWLVKGEVRYFALLVRMPPETAAGSYHVQAHAELALDFAPPIVDMTPADNTVDVTVVVPAA